MVSQHLQGELVFAWQLQAAPREQGHPEESNFPQNHKAAFTHRLPGLGSGFTATLPESTNSSAAVTGKGEEKPLHLPARLRESG